MHFLELQAEAKGLRKLISTIFDRMWAPLVVHQSSVPALCTNLKHPQTHNLKRQ